MRAISCLLLTACAAPIGQRSAPNLVGETPRPELTRELTQEAVTFQTADNVRIAALWYAANVTGGPRPALLLLHGGNRYKERWQEAGFVEALADDNYHFLAIDIRGRGESEAGNEQELRRDPTLARHDVRAALAWLAERPDVDPDQIALVGSSYGANLACAGGLGWGFDVATVVCFSATAATHRFLRNTPATQSLPTGLFLACDDEPDRYAAPQTARRLASETAGVHQVVIYPGPFHALSMFENVPACQTVVRDWLRARLNGSKAVTVDRPDGLTPRGQDGG